jgi:hypothetical protein
VNIVAATGNTERSNVDVNIVAAVAGNTIDGSTERTNAEVETNTARDGCAARSTEGGLVQLVFTLELLHLTLKGLVL